jgi:DNA uptake protein ComE-like DNA-binding protein
MVRAGHLSRRLALVLTVVAPLARRAHGQARPAAPVHASSAIDLNSASRDELMALDGIGEVRADAIIRARPFRTKTDLVERWIIPEALYEKLAGKVTVRPMASPPPSARPAASPARR